MVEGLPDDGGRREHDTLVSDQRLALRNQKKLLLDKTYDAD